MTALARKIVVDTATTEFATDVVAGLTATPKRLSPKYFYDGAGSALFEQITALPDYYPTRREIGILDEHAGDIADATESRRELLDELVAMGAELEQFDEPIGPSTDAPLRRPNLRQLKSSDEGVPHLIAPLDPLADFPVQRVVSMEYAEVAGTQRGEIVGTVPAESLLPYVHQRYDDLSVLGAST